MNVEQLDQRLRSLGEAESELAGQLVELDDDPTFKLLAGGPRSGVTRERLDAILKEAPQLWPRFTKFREALVAIRDLRGDRSRLDDEVKVELAAQLSGAEADCANLCESVRSLRDGVTAVEARWREVVPRVDRGRALLARLQAGSDADASGDPALDALADQLDAVEQSLAEDPLGVDSNRLDALDAATHIAEQRSAAMQRNRDALPADIERGRRLVDELRAMRTEAVEAAEASRVKIRNPVGLRPVPDLAFDELTAAWIAARDAPGGWLPRRRALDRFLAQIEAQRLVLAAARSANRAPLARRNELRGLLDAYRAKAAATGRAEEEQFAALARAAQQELHIAPTDLARAEDLLQSLSTLLAAPDADRSPNRPTNRASAKSAEVKPAEVKPAEAKPAEAKPAEPEFSPEGGT